MYMEAFCFFRMCKYLMVWNSKWNSTFLAILKNLCWNSWDQWGSWMWRCFLFVFLFFIDGRSALLEFLVYKYKFLYIIWMKTTTTWPRWLDKHVQLSLGSTTNHLISLRTPFFKVSKWPFGLNLMNKAFKYLFLRKFECKCYIRIFDVLFHYKFITM